ncbi:SDR family NAD(P)-dependent oxidoreductase [Kitasatospora griseola]|uniref:SDR family NAD(P)-dependent oxidoreductase n=1 Tax=Kitasatospora griseola TaxID=2064 RepID=UPI0036DA30DA
MGRSVVVTDADHGIGEEAALRLAGAGFEVVATSRTGAGAERLRARARDGGVRLRAVELDVTEPGACEEVLGDVRRWTGGGPWAVVNQVAVAAARAVEDTGEEQARRLMEANVFVQARIARLVLPGMRRAGGGRIVTISSASARAVLPLLGWYSASRAASAALHHALRVEAAPFGVRVVLVEHGFHTTGLVDQAVRTLAEPSAVSPRFSACYRGVAAALGDRSRLVGPERAAAAVHRALVADRPRARYCVGRDARVGAALDACAPFAVGDAVKRALLGLSGPPSRAERLLARLCGLPEF